LRSGATVRIAVLAGVAGLIGIGAVVLGCADRRSEEKAAALAYGAAAAQALPLQVAFLAAWKESRETDTVAALRTAGAEQVLPAFDRYVAALSALPAEGGGRLGELHGALVAAWRQFGERLRLYYDRVTIDNFPKRTERLQSAWAELGARIVTYRDELGEHFRALGLELRGDGGTAATTPGAASGAASGAPTGEGGGGR
jgi:hypothetical protein